MIPNVGKPLDRVDGRPKTTGRARYAAEHNLENMAYGVLVMSTIPAGTVRSIDASAALKSPGVIAVISHLNAPKLNDNQGKNGLRESQLVPFANASIHYTGQRIAVVIADTLEHATHAAELVRVTYDAAPARIDIQQFRGDATDRSKSKFSKGDADAAFASAPVKVDQVYRTPHQHHNPLEAHSLVAAWKGDELTLYESTQNIFGVQSSLATLFSMPKEKVHVVSQFVGGAFGSKGGVWPHVVIAALAARRTAS